MRRSGAQHLRRRIGLTLGVAWLLFAGPLAGVAGAHGSDAATSSNYRSRITAVEPALDGIRVRVVEAGNRLELTNATDVDAVVMGYNAEPYLRIGPGGVYENTRSPATYLNATRDGFSPVPDGADPLAEPDWRRVSGGTAARWHDHRAHWMSPEPPPAVQRDPGQPQAVIPEWSVPIMVGDRVVTATGDLYWIPPPNQLRWYGLALVTVLLVSAALLMRRTRRRALVVALVVGAVLESGYSLAIEAGPGRGDLSHWVGTALAWAAVAALLWHLPSRPRRALAAAALGGLVLVSFGGSDHSDVLQYSQLTVRGPVPVARTVVSVELGLGAAVLAGALRGLFLRGGRNAEDAR